MIHYEKIIYLFMHIHVYWQYWTIDYRQMQHEFYFPDEISVYIVEHLEQNLLLPMIEVLYVDPIDKKEKIFE